MNNILLGISIVLTVMVISLFSIPFVVDWNSYKAVLSQKIHALTSHQVDIKGDIEIRILPIPYVYIKDIHLYSDVAKSQAVFYTKSLEMRLSLLPFINGDIDIQSLDLDEPHFFVRRTKQGEYHSLFSNFIRKSVKNTKGDIDFRQLFIEGIDIRNATLSYIDDKYQFHRDIYPIDAYYQSDFTTGPQKLEGKIKHEDYPLDFRLRFIKADKKNIIKTVGTLTLGESKNVSEQSLRLDFDGIIEPHDDMFSQFDGKVKLRKGSLNTISQLIKYDKDKNDDLINKDVSYISANLTLNPERVHVKNLEIAIGDDNKNKKYKFQGNASIQAGRVLFLKAHFLSPFIDMDQIHASKKVSATKGTDLFKKNVMIKEAVKINPNSVQKIVSTIFSLESSMRGTFTFDVQNFQYANRLFKDVKFEFNLNKQENKAVIQGAYGEQGYVNVLFNQVNRTLPLYAKIIWNSPKFKEDIAIFIPTRFQSDFPYDMLPLNSRLEVWANYNSDLWSIEQASLEYGNEKIEYKQESHKSNNSSLRLNLTSVVLDKWVAIIQWVNRNKFVSFFTDNTEKLWLIRAKNAQFGHKKLHLIEMDMRLNHNQEGVKIITDNLSVYTDSQEKMLTKAVLQFDNQGVPQQGRIEVHMNNIMMGHYFMPSVRNVLPENVEQFFLNTITSDMVAEINISRGFPSNRMVVVTEVKAQMLDETSVFFTGYYENDIQNYKTADIKFSVSTFNLPSHVIAPYLPTYYVKRKKEKIDMNIYVNKFYDNPYYNITTKLRTGPYGYIVKGDVRQKSYKKKEQAQKAYVYRGVLQIDNNDPWTGKTLVSQKTKTKIVAHFEHKDDNLNVRVQKAMFQDVPFSFVGRYTPSQDAMVKPSFEATLTTDFLSLPVFMHEVFLSPQSMDTRDRFWLSHDIFSLKKWHSTDARMNINVKDLALSDTMSIKNSRINITYDGQDVEAFLGGDYNNGDFKANLQMNPTEQFMYVNGDIKILSDNLYPLTQAKGEITAQYTSKGNSVVDVIGNLKGQGRFRFVDGEIQGFNGKNFSQIGNWILEQSEAQFKTSLTTLKRDLSVMPYQILEGNYVIDDGLLSSKDVRLMSDYYTMQGTMFLDMSNLVMDASLDMRMKALPRAPTITMVVTGSTMAKLNKDIDFTPLFPYYALAQLEKNLIKTEKELERLDENQ